MHLWRISNYPSLNGEGGRLSPGRWNSGGFPVVYLAESPPGALIEVLVHLEIKDFTLPRSFNLLRISAGDMLKIPLLKVPDEGDWKDNEALTRTVGDAWLQSQSSVLARVPSAILPSTFNYLLNPLHRDASRIAISDSEPALFDLRLFRNRHN